MCEIHSFLNKKEEISIRYLNNGDNKFIRDKISLSIMEKIKNKKYPNIIETKIFCGLNQFGVPSNFQGKKEKDNKNYIPLFTSKGWVYCSREDIKNGFEIIDKYKIVLSKITSEHGGEPDKNGMFKVFAGLSIINPGEICNQSYICLFPTNDFKHIKNFYTYLKSKFVRFIVWQSINGINISSKCFIYVPNLDFNIYYRDSDLYKLFELNNYEIEFIESTIKEMK